MFPLFLIINNSDKHIFLPSLPYPKSKQMAVVAWVHTNTNTTVHTHTHTHTHTPFQKEQFGGFIYLYFFKFYLNKKDLFKSFP